MSVRAIARALVPAAVVFLAVGCLLSFTYFHDNKYAAPPPYGDDGSIALSDDDVARPVPLVDGWLVSVDGSAPIETFIGQYSNFSYLPNGTSAFGSATYRLDVRYEGSRAERALVILLPEVFTDYALYANGIPVASDKTGPEAALIVGEHTELVLEVRNQSHYYSGLVYPPLIGSAQAIAQVELANSLLSGVLVLFPLVSALFAFAVYGHRGEDPVVRDFGLLCLALSVAGWRGIAWRLGLGDPWVYALEDAAWTAVFVCAASVAMRSTGVLDRSQARAARWIMLVFPLVTLVWVAAVIPLWPATIEAYGVYQTLLRLGCWVMLTACAAIGLGSRSPEARYILCACAALGASLGANLLDDNAYEPLYGLWQQEYAALAMVAVFACMLVVRVRRMSAAQEQVRELSVQVRATKDSLLHMRRAEEATRMARHDLRHHVETLRGLLEEGAFDRCRSYLDELACGHDAAAPVRYSGNLVVNAALTGYLAPAQERGVEVRCDVRVPEELPLRDTELAVLLSNMLSNASEACDRARLAGHRRPYVDFAMRVEGDRLVARCENVMPADASFDATSKSDGGDHGWGLPAMRQIVEAHDGALVIDSGEDAIVVRLVLKLGNGAAARS